MCTRACWRWELVFQCHNLKGKWYSVLEVSTQLASHDAIYDLYINVKKLQRKDCRNG